MSFKDAWEKLESAVADLSTLTVRTYSGKLAIAVDAGSTDWDKILKDAQTTGGLTLECLTVVKLDRDTDLVINTNSKELLAAHKDAVESAQRARQAMVELVGRTLGKLVK